MSAEHSPLHHTAKSCLQNTKSPRSLLRPRTLLTEPAACGLVLACHRWHLGALRGESWEGLPGSEVSPGGLMMVKCSPLTTFPFSP